MDTRIPLIIDPSGQYELTPGIMIAKLLAGFFEVGPGVNEIALVSTSPDGDPAFLRVGGMFGNGGGLMGDLNVAAEPDSQTGVRRRDNAILIQYKRDERLRDLNRPDITYGELTVHILGPKSERWPDGLMLVMLVLHDYVWIKGISGTLEPEKPMLVIPPLPEPPPEPIDPWLLEAEKHIAEIDEINREFVNASGNPDFVVDSDAREAYLSGRNKDLQEIHDDMVDRFGHDPGPCQWSMEQ